MAMIKNVLEYLEQNASRYPDKISYADTKYLYTYSELLNASKKIGSYIASNVATRRAVLVYMDKGAKNLAAFFGAVYGGNYYIPIDPLMPTDRINLIIKTAEPVLIIYDDKTEKNMVQLETDCIKVKFDEVVNTEVCEKKLLDIRKRMIDTDLLYILFTSGSTGTPKGVAVCHRSVIDYAEWLRDTFSFDSNTIFGNQTPFYFSMSVLDIYANLCVGATLWVIPKMLFSFPIRLLQFINEKQVNSVYWVPSALNIVANLGALDEIELPYLDKILFAGEVMPTKQLNIWRKHLPNALYANLFGPTEITDIGVYYILDREFKDDEPIPIGRACDNVDLLVINENGKEVTEVGEIGELLIRGSFLAMGYFNNPEKTKESFIQNPINNAYPEIVYKTGDLVYWNEMGELVYKARKDFQIKHMGNRIELGEIESMLSAQESIEMSCCVYSSVTDQIKAIYVGDVSEEELREYMRKKVPQYMLPEVYIKLSVMPLNMNGKIDRALLNKNYGGK